MSWPGRMENLKPANPRVCFNPAFSRKTFHASERMRIREAAQPQAANIPALWAGSIRAAGPDAVDGTWGETSHRFPPMFPFPAEGKIASLTSGTEERLRGL